MKRFIAYALLLGSSSLCAQDAWNQLEEHFKDRFMQASYGIHALMRNDIPEALVLSMTDDMDDPFDGYLCDGASAYVYQEIALMNEEDPLLKAEVEVWKGVDHYALFSHMYPKVRLGTQTRVLDLVPPYLSMAQGSFTHRDLEPLKKDDIEKKLIPSKLSAFSNQMLPFRYLETDEGGYLTLLGIESGPQDLLSILAKHAKGEDILYSVAIETYFVKKGALRPAYDPKKANLPPYPFERRTFQVDFKRAMEFDFAYRDGNFLERQGRWVQIRDDEFREFYRAATKEGAVAMATFQNHPKRQHDFKSMGESEAELAVGQWIDFLVKWATRERN